GAARRRPGGLRPHRAVALSGFSGAVVPLQSGLWPAGAALAGDDPGTVRAGPARLPGVVAPPGAAASLLSAASGPHADARPGEPADPAFLCRDDGRAPARPQRHRGRLAG